MKDEDQNILRGVNKLAEEPAESEAAEEPHVVPPSESVSAFGNQTLGDVALPPSEDISTLGLGNPW